MTQTSQTLDAEAIKHLLLEMATYGQIWVHTSLAAKPDPRYPAHISSPSKRGRLCMH